MSDRPPLSHRFPESTRVDIAWWDPDLRTITVQFPDGKQWRYHNIDEQDWAGFINTGSAGRYIAEVLDLHSNGPA